MKGDAAPVGEGAAPEVVALARVVARLRSELADLEGVAATTAVVERATGVLMVRAGVSADTAYALLLERAGRRGRTVLEESWITLGRVRARRSPGAARISLPTASVTAPTVSSTTGPTSCPATAPATGPKDEPGTSVFSPRRRRAGHPHADDGVSALLARIADGLAAGHGGDDIAELLVTVLGGATGVDSVMIYTVAAAGSLDLTASAGIAPALAEQWRHIPPLSGVAAHEAIAGRRALWLEDLEQDARRYLLIGDPPERWASRAWVPVPGTGSPRAVIGFLRTRPGPFAADSRVLLRQA
ncbi:ANTAR domain-containing protein, partial [Streptomyces sp. NPDC006450]|uniref:ANTAR domain-containing protein n=1 Tax=Streptomyces sp. NPDC006450 TaxID=3155458 RepID=UPI0033B128EE